MSHITFPPEPKNVLGVGGKKFDLPKFVCFLLCLISAGLEAGVPVLPTKVPILGLKCRLRAEKKKEPNRKYQNSSKT